MATTPTYTIFIHRANFGSKLSLYTENKIPKKVAYWSIEEPVNGLLAPVPVLPKNADGTTGLPLYGIYREGQRVALHFYDQQQQEVDTINNVTLLKRGGSIRV